MASNYILGRLRHNCESVLNLAKYEGAIGHPGVKGRFRELLINNLLIPWLPPAVGCGTGIIIDAEQDVSGARQDDIVLFDSTLVPPILVSAVSTTGVYMFDGVLCRIEVKSTLTRTDIESFVVSSRRIAGMKFVARPGRPDSVFGPLNMLLAYDSSVQQGSELAYLKQCEQKHGVEPGMVSALCIANRGFWLLARREGTPHWKRLVVKSPNDPLAYFIGVTSNSVFDQRAARHGTVPLGGGAGLYLDHPFEWAD